MTLTAAQDLLAVHGKQTIEPFMPTATATKAKSQRRRRAGSPGRLANSEINSRLEQIELATVSSLRALQMDIEGDKGVPSSEVLRKARLAPR